MAEWWVNSLIVLLVVLVVRRFKSDWRSYMVIAGGFLSLFVGRRAEIDRIVVLPPLLYTICLIIGAETDDEAAAWATFERLADDLGYWDDGV